MPGLGTLINMLAIIVGGLIGLTARNYLNQRLLDNLMVAMSACIIFIGLAGAVKESLLFDGQTLVVTNLMMMVITFIIGTVIGEIIDLDKKLEEFGAWLRVKSKNEGEGTFTQGFLAASFTVCIGAMSIIGSIKDATGDPSILLAKDDGWDYRHDYDDDHGQGLYLCRHSGRHRARSRDLVGLLYCTVAHGSGT